MYQEHSNCCSPNWIYETKYLLHIFSGKGFLQDRTLVLEIEDIFSGTGFFRHRRRFRQMFWKLKTFFSCFLWTQVQYSFGNWRHFLWQRFSFGTGTFRQRFWKFKKLFSGSRGFLRSGSVKLAAGAKQSLKLPPLHYTHCKLFSQTGNSL